MVPPDGDSKSVRNININKEKRDGDTDFGVDENLNRPPRNNEFNPRSRNKSYKGWFIGLGVIILIFVFVSLTPVLSKAQVEVTPRSQSVEISGLFTAVLENSEDEGDLVYQTTSIEMTGEMDVSATGEEEVTRKAAGTIKISNTYSAEPETFIANTRFQSKEGLIYRVSNSITIPGYKKNGDQIVAGTLEVTVFADEAGEKYNTNSANFTIPGLSGDPRFEKINAQTVTPISGGFIGVAKVAKEGDVTSARNSIRNDLEDKILEKAITDVPEDFLVLQETASIVFESLPEESGSSDSVKVKEKAIVTVALFKKSDLASFIAKQSMGDYEGESVRISNLEDLQIAVESGNSETENTPQLGSFDFSISGSPNIVWVVDFDAFRSDLLGVSRDEALEVLSDYPSVKSVDIKISPFWRRSIPDQRDKVSLEEVLSAESRND